MSKTRVTALLLLVAVFTPLTQARGARAQEPATQQPPPADPLLLVDQGLEKIDKGDVEGAVLLFKEASKANPKPDKLMLLEALIYVSTGTSGPDAIALLNNYNKSREGSRDHRGFAALGKLYIDSHMYYPAVANLREARKWAPGDQPVVRAKIIADLAWALANYPKTDEAIDAAKEAVSLAPGEGEIQLRMCEVASTAGRMDLLTTAADQALAIFERKIRDDPFDHDAHQKAIQIYDLLAYPYRQRMGSASDKGENYNKYAKLLIAQDPYRARLQRLKAMEYAEQAVKHEPKNPDFLVDLAQIEVDLGGHREAREHLQEALRLQPGHERALELLRRLDAESESAASQQEPR